MTDVFECSTCHGEFRDLATSCTFPTSGESCGRLLCETCRLRAPGWSSLGALCSGHFYFVNRNGIEAAKNDARVKFFLQWMRSTSPPPLPLLVYSSGSGSHHADSPACVGIVVADALGRILCEQSQYVTVAGATEAGAIAIGYALALVSDLRASREAIVLYASDVNSIRRVDRSWSPWVRGGTKVQGVETRHVKAKSGVPGNELSHWLARAARIDRLTRLGHFDGKPWAPCTTSANCKNFPECVHVLPPRPVEDLRLAMRPYQDRFPNRVGW